MASKPRRLRKYPPPTLSALGAEERDRITAANHLSILEECRARLKAQNSPQLAQAIENTSISIGNLIRTSTPHREAAAELFLSFGNPLRR